ncbi:type 1 periplasmic binding fold superfamily protein [Polaribacter sp.]|nr:type 1 periplasmic binding fold superfamily protein [Polaribacter sp.]
MKIFKNLALVFFVATAFTACSSDDPEVVNEEELITTLTATLKPIGGGTDIILKSVDLDGDGPDAPVISVSANLSANTNYSGVLKVENETESPAEDITLEVLEEDEEHQFFFTPTNNIATVTYDDMDGDGNPIGVQFSLATTTAATGNLTITLRHEPIKTASGVSNGDITNAGGETDVQAVFPITVQ